jgi:hypothetical protein
VDRSRLLPPLVDRQDNAAVQELCVFRTHLNADSETT